MPGVGAVLAIRGYRRVAADNTGRTGVYLTTFGMLAYGGYPFWSATYQLGNMQGFVKRVGIVYSVLGIVAWIVGRDLRIGRVTPETSMPDTSLIDDR